MTLAVRNTTGTRYKITGWMNETTEVIWSGVIMGEESKEKIAAVIRHIAESKKEEDPEQSGRLNFLAGRVDVEGAHIERSRIMTWHAE